MDSCYLIKLKVLYFIQLIKMYTKFIHIIITVYVTFIGNSGRCHLYMIRLLCRDHICSRDRFQLMFYN